LQISKPKKGYKLVDAGFGKFEEIPEKWEDSNIGKIGTYVNGKAFKPSEWQKTGVPIIRIQNLTDESNDFNYSKDNFKKKYEINDGDILVSWSASLGCFKWNRGKAVLNQHIFKAIQNNDVSLDFFYYVLSNSMEKMKKMVHGSTMQHITLKPFLETKIALPTFKEQQKISSFLLNIDNVLEKINQLIQKSELLKKGLTQKLFTKGIGHTKFKKVEWFFGKEIEIPEEWEMELLDRIAKRGSGHTPDAKITNYYNGGIKWISLADTKKLDNIFIYETEKEISKEGIKHSSAEIHPAGTVLVSRDAGVGKSAIMATEMAVSQHFITWNCSENLDNHFLYYTLQFLKPIFERIATGATILTIGLPFFKKMEIALPDIAEQKQIATILSNVDSQITKEKLQKSNLELLKKGLVQKLLTGQIRVKV